MPGSAPVITSNGGLSTADIALDENLTAVTTVEATDLDGDSLVFSITGGLDKSKFKINATTGVLQFISAPDYENPKDNGGDNTYQVIVTVSDGDLTSSQTITVTVGNVGVTLDGTTDDDFLGPSGTTSDGDILNGYEGNDWLDGGLGADTMDGGDGQDFYTVDNAGDVIVEGNADIFTGGDDYVFSTVTYTLSDNVEHLHLSGTASLNATGNDGANHLQGNDGNNILDGKGGGDRLDGGLGNDTMIVDSTADSVLEFADEGTDTVQSSISYTLTSNVENLTLTGAVGLLGVGNILDNVLRGTSAADELRGQAGNDTLIGGAGADLMKGNSGDDTYYVDDDLDVVVEILNSGTDTVHSTKTHTLSSNVENLVLDGNSAIGGTGNELANVLTGNGAANILTGLGGHDQINGGAGADQMTGGLGNDKYWVSGTGDVVVELADEGTDWVVSSITHTLADNVEKLTLTGLTSIHGTGNALDNKITGNIVANTLSGLDGNDTLNGGRGADTMIGGLGNDTIYVDNLSDNVVELADEGIDTVILSKSGYVLADNVENLQLAGKAWYNGYGNGLDNLITGNAGYNLLDGGDGDDTIYGEGGDDQIAGGAGYDDLFGGAGNDKFVFNSATESGGADVGDIIYDFVRGKDKIDLSAIDADETVAGDQAFVLDTDGIPDPGEIYVDTTFAADHIILVYVNTDLDLANEMVIQVNGPANLTVSDFIL